jgi:catechol 2,3-dioxygenase-like lactoylglutathione lyase family enzyme
MLDHVAFSVGDLGQAKAFYAKALAPLGIAALMEVTPEMTGGADAYVGFGDGGKPYFWIASGGKHSPHMHVAFAAPDRETVDAFHKAALAAGGTDNGAPGLRPHYHANYYGAFVRDPDGHNIEAVCHAPGRHG